ncbi:MAG: hypothetical protein QOF58_2437 [Pseudonocardiales bacterium]|nr:hypothetical protein [Pseudonocardiales bacterium]
MAGGVSGVVVNHNTSTYAELLLRSLFARHGSGLDLDVTVYDNESTDDTAGLRAYAAARGIPVLPSGFGRGMPHNSHGAVLDRFVLEHPDCDYYLFLDSDVVFIQDDTLHTMRAELEADESAFGVGARMSWDGEAEVPQAALDQNPGIYADRLHPCCALVRNTPAFRRVVEEIGLGCAKLLRPDREEYVDTFRLATMAMRTHGYRHIRSAKMVLHFFCVSYDPSFLESKNRRRDALLHALRRGEANPPSTRLTASASR